MTEPGRFAKVRPADLLAATAVLLSGALLLHLLAGLTYHLDEWEILLHRRSWGVDAFLDPWLEHPIAIPTLIYKVMFVAFGMGSPTPVQLASVSLFLLSVALLFVYIRRRTGPWLALAAILPILFLGPAWADLLWPFWPFQIGFFGSMACGLGALLALERRDSGGDAGATALLTASLFFSSFGIPFVMGTAVEVALSRKRLKRAFAVGLPTALWLLWYLGWGHEAQSHASFHNAVNMPAYVFDGLASSLAALLGLVGETEASSLDWGRPLLVLVIAFTGWRLYRIGRPPARLLAVLTVLLGFWSLAALSTMSVRAPTVSRYQYLGVILILLVAAELVRGARMGRGTVAVTLLVGIAAALANVSQLRDMAQSLKGISQQERGGLAALELTRDQVDAGFKLTPENSTVDYLGLVDAGSYFSAVDAYGSPAYSPTELTSAPEPARYAADVVFASVLGAKLTHARSAQRGPCRISPPPATGISMRLPPGGVLLRARDPGGQIAVRRYASQSFPVPLGPLQPRAWLLLRIPPDRSKQPWRFEVRGAATSICEAATHEPVRP